MYLLFEDKNLIEGKKISKKRRYGNRFYSSNNVLDKKLCSKKDDIISLFYILIDFYTGDLSWIKAEKEGKILSWKKIKQIRELYQPENFL